MTTLLKLGSVEVEVTHKDVKHIHLTVHPPDGRVKIAAPEWMDGERVRLFAISKLPWIRKHQKAFTGQAREPEREYLERESHYVWGRRYLMKIVEREAPPSVELAHRKLVLHVRPGTSVERRAEVLALWYRQQIRAAIVPMLEKWQRELGVRVNHVFIQRMTTKWGSCNPETGNIRLNTELAKKAPEGLEYVLVHELAHLLVPTHSAAFKELLDRHMPHWEQVRRDLGAGPI